jgi:hypothetical protein
MVFTQFSILAWTMAIHAGTARDHAVPSLRPFGREMGEHLRYFSKKQTRMRAEGTVK